MDLRKLKTLIDLVAESDIAELEVTEGENKVRILKSSPVAPGQMVMMQPQANYAPAITASAATPVGMPAATVATEPAIPEGHVVKSPMVGTFYRSSTPGTPSYVEIGSSVKEGDTLCIIEAMKLLNEIDADKSGIITQILAENGQPVEFGQALFVIA
ncbi:MAG: acetyl-CoA carboxylase biotin carboxyl carrier protein [Herbaspirillum sp.]